MASFKDHEKHLIHFLSTIDPYSIQRLDHPGRKRSNAFLRRLRNQRAFDKIALALGKAIYAIIPFQTKEAYNLILMGTANGAVAHKGFLGWKVFLKLPQEFISPDEIKERLADPVVERKLRKIFKASQTFLIKPMMLLCIKEAEKGHDGRYRAQMNRYLNMDQLDGKSQTGWIAMELFSRLIEQNIVCELPGRAARYQKISTAMYESPRWQSPKAGFSRLHTKGIDMVKSIFKKLPGEWKQGQEIKLQEKHGFKGWMRYDTMIYKNRQEWGIIEWDGVQHNTYLPGWCHRPKKSTFIEDNGRMLTSEEVFAQLQKKDEMKNNAALARTGHRCLRVREGTRDSEIKNKIEEWIKKL